jgi:hypothetical protein
MVAMPDILVRYSQMVPGVPENFCFADEDEAGEDAREEGNKYGK